MPKNDKGQSDVTSSIYAHSGMSLGEKTRVYWTISSAYHSKNIDLILTTERALNAFNKLTPILDPNRPLSNRLRTLRDEIIRGPEHVNAANMTANQ